MRELLIPGPIARRVRLRSLSLFSFFRPKKVMGVGGVGNPRAVRVFQATCGRVLCVHRRDTVHALFARLAEEVPPIEYSAPCASWRHVVVVARACDKNLPRRPV